MGLKRATIIVNNEKIRVDAVKKEVTGPEPLMSILYEANERLKGDWTICYCYGQSPPDKLWNTDSLYPLLVHLFGKENVRYDKSEPFERWNEGPTPPGIVY